MELSVINKKLAMDSRDIAELTHKRHSDVMRDIDRMLPKIANANVRRLTYKDRQGKERPYYCLPHRELLVLLTGYSVELRTAVIDRWAFLERGYRADRVKSIELRKEFTDELKERGYDKQYQYIQTTNQMKKALGISNKKNDMIRREFNAIAASEALAKVMLSDEYGYYQVNPVCVNASKVVREVTTKSITA